MFVFGGHLLLYRLSQNSCVITSNEINRTTVDIRLELRIKFTIIFCVTKGLVSNITMDSAGDVKFIIVFHLTVVISLEIHSCSNSVRLVI